MAGKAKSVYLTINAGTKGTQDVAVADKLIAKIDEIAEIFWATKKA
jgi:nickel superoxide dismutase